jgi:hypothetical protein
MMQAVVNKIRELAFYDYSNNKASEEELDGFSQDMQKKFGWSIDQDYRVFLSWINGFELNGLNFYGTKEQKDIGVLSSINQNFFWGMELPALKGYAIIGDGDMDFYCYDGASREYKVFTKGSLQEVAKFSSFKDLIKELVNVYS